MNRERGYASLIVLGLVAIAVLGALGGFAWERYNAGKKAGIAQEQPKTKAAEQRAELAEARAGQLDAQLAEAIEINKRNAAEVETLRSRFAATQSMLDQIQALQRQQEEKTRAALASFAAREQRQRAEIQRLKVIAETPGDITITDRGPSEADAILRNALRDVLGLRKP